MNLDLYLRILLSTGYWGKLIYLIVTRLNITYVVGLVSQLIKNHKEVHWKAALRILIYIKRSSGKGLLYKKNEHLRVDACSEGIREIRSPLLTIVFTLEEI